MAGTFHPLKVSDGTWDGFYADWSAQCTALGDEIDNYAPATLKELSALAANGHPRAEVFGLKIESEYGIVCQINRVPLPGYDGPVLRVRFLTLSPRFDLGEYEIDDYANLLVQVLNATLRLARIGPMAARHIKMHLRSPADRQFFAMLGKELNTIDFFESVQTHGAWLYISLRASSEL